MASLLSGLSGTVCGPPGPGQCPMAPPSEGWVLHQGLSSLSSPRRAFQQVPLIDRRP